MAWSETTVAADPGRGRRGVLVLWLLLGVAVTGKTLLVPDDKSVFPKFAAGALHWWERAPVYADHKDLGSFRYPPAFALFMTPFALLGLRLGGVLYSLVNLAVYVTGLGAFLRQLLPARLSERARWVFLLLATVGAVRPLWNAQSHVLVSGLLLWGGAFAVRGRHGPAALLLAVPVYCKVAPLASGLLCCAALPALFTLRYLACLLLFALLPYAAAPAGYATEQYAAWFAHIAETSARRWDSFRDVWFAWEWLAPPVHVPSYRLLQAAGALLALLGVLREQRLERRSALLFALALGASWQMLFGPAVDYKACVILAPFLAFALVGSRARSSDRALATGAYLLATLVAAGAVERALAPLLPPVRLALPLGAALFCVWLFREGRTAFTAPGTGEA